MKYFEVSMSRRKVSNPLALAVLACLWERPMYPYEITMALRHRGKEQSIRLNFGSLYAVMKSMEKHGFIEVQHAEREGNRPERSVYAITPAGRRESDEWLRELLSTPVKEYPDFEAGLSLLPMLLPEVVLGLLTERLGRLDASLADLAVQRADPGTARLPELFMIEFDYHEAMVRAEWQFVGELVGKLESGTLGGHAEWGRMHQLLAEGHSLGELFRNASTYLGKEAAGLLNMANPVGDDSGPDASASGIQRHRSIPAARSR
jgi:DNA-binding PadR family transcriptional regulator